MRIVVWNCSMALHGKLAALRSLKPDIAVIPEAAAPAIVRDHAGLLVPDHVVWVGRHRRKGLMILAFGDWMVRLDPQYTDTLREIAPVHVDGPFPFRLLAVWAFNRGDNFDEAGRGPILRSLDHYRDFVNSDRLVVAGDFNNNVLWDVKPKKPNNRHAHVVAALADRGLVSAYHHSRGIGQGNEPEPTLYWQTRRKDGRTYHIDYVFVPATWADRLAAVTVGEFEPWVGAGLSDHVPLIVDVDVT